MISMIPQPVSRNRLVRDQGLDEHLVREVAVQASLISRHRQGPPRDAVNRESQRFCSKNAMVRSIDASHAASKACGSPG
jgi:hypothetical protein